MRAFLTNHLLALLLLAALAGNVAAGPPAGSQLALEENRCATCHGEEGKEMWVSDPPHKDDRPGLFVSAKSLSGDVHFLKGVNCHDCHGGDPGTLGEPQAHATEVPQRTNGVQPFRASLDDMQQACAACHQDKLTSLLGSAHADAKSDGAKSENNAKTPLPCGDCHGEKMHGMLPVADDRSPVSIDRRVVTCGRCHQDELASLRASVHRHGGEKDEEGSGKILDCFACHGSDVHGIPPAKDTRSPVFLDHQIKVCGGCHQGDLETYSKSVHGVGLFESGLVVVPACANCHGSHGIYYAADKRSTLHKSNVAATCGKCHDEIEQRLQQSVHGRGEDPDGATERPAPGGRWKRNPTCTDCHQGHHLLDPEQAAFQIESVNRCGNCHPALSARYAMSLHGELTEMGYEAAAKCSDCHGFHDILATDDPKSPLAAGENRLATCRKCHPNAVANFTDFDPHADYHDAEDYPLLHYVYEGLLALFYFFFAFFVIHGFLWFVRSFVETIQRGGHKTLVTEKTVLVRFEPRQRVFYALLLSSFLGLVLTGLPLKYGSQAWAKLLARGLGGFESTSVWHHFFATVAIFGCLAHVVWGIMKIVELRREKASWGTIVFGPDSPVPTHKDLKVMLDMARWFLGMGRRPVFERWTYWEKFDYWAVYLAAAVIGTSGLLLWYPNVFVRILPGEVLNLAKVVHAEVAILAASFLFIFHFYHSHFRPEKFPLDLSALTGLVSEEHQRKHRPEYVARLERTGKLEALRRPAPSKRRLWLVFVAGLVVYSLGLGLLAVVLLATLGK